MIPVGAQAGALKREFLTGYKERRFEGRLFCFRIFNMDQLTKNVMGAFGNHGALWIESLPRLKQACTQLWNLEELSPIPNMSWGYVAYARQGNQLVVLKLIPDQNTYESEKESLALFSGPGCVHVLGASDAYQALLLGRVLPGTPLLEAEMTEGSKIELYAQLILSRPLINDVDLTSFKRCEEWLEAIDMVAKQTHQTVVPKTLLKEAIGLKTMLLESASESILLHGDLHQENVLIGPESTPYMIDPKGIVGEGAFEVSCFNFIPEEKENAHVREIFKKRVQKLAGLLKLDSDRIEKWVKVRLVLAACWCVQDQISPDRFLKRYQRLFGSRAD